MSSLCSRRTEFFVLLMAICCGVFGNFISSKVGVNRIHYVPMGLSFVYFLSRCDHKYLVFLTATAFVAFVYAGPTFSFVAAMQIFLVPVVLFFGVRDSTYKNLIYVIAASQILLFVGVAIDFFEIFKFEKIYFTHNGINYLRYAGPAGSALASGYLAGLAVAAAAYCKNRYMLLAFLISIVFVQILSHSRGAWVATLCGLGFVLFLWLCSFSKQRFAALITSAVIGFVTISIDKLSGSRILNWSSDLGNTGRIRQWKYCFNNFQANWITGTSWGMFSPIGHSQAPGDIYFDSTSPILRSCESLPLQVLTEYGVILGGIYLLVSSCILWFVFRHILLCASQCSRDVYAYGYILTFVLASQIYNQTLNSYWIAVVFFITLGSAFKIFTSDYFVCSRSSSMSFGAFPVERLR